VLVVEDDLDTREMLRQVLAACGARVALAASATQAMLAFTRGETPDVLVSDLGMPEVTGFDLIEWVRALPPESGGKVPAAALSAYAREADRRAVLAAGFDLHIPKPIDPTDLCATVERLSRLR
jgi:CheY-like chemotaxis protein